MNDNFTKLEFEKTLCVDKIITIFYMALGKNFYHDGEAHDFWEMVYIDKGEMICTADKKRFVLKSGEMTFHKPNEFHNLSGDSLVEPKVSIITFECRDEVMQCFDGRIFKLTAEERALLSMLISEGLSCYRLLEETNPLLQKMVKLEDAPTGSSQMTKNLLEIFLIKLMRHTEMITKDMRTSILIDGREISYDLKEILDFIQSKIYDRLTIRDIARHIGKSESAVKQLFSAYKCDGIINYYNQLKIKEAKKLIRGGQHNMTQISDMLHFDNPQYFSKAFKTIAGATPSEYKNSIFKDT